VTFVVKEIYARPAYLTREPMRQFSTVARFRQDMERGPKKRRSTDGSVLTRCGAVRGRDRHAAVPQRDVLT